ncbi:MAG: DUF2892 domain-containing protein [Marinilabiliales bacterium]|nr:MAG: DUF2892 domain-containing protein [Marinilabiliales bacterium]
MKKNMGIADRVLRIMLAVLAIVLYFTGVVAGPLGITILAIAGVFLLVSFIGSCPLYLPFGIRTRPGTD